VTGGKVLLREGGVDGLEQLELERVRLILDAGVLSTAFRQNFRPGRERPGRVQRGEDRGEEDEQRPVEGEEKTASSSSVWLGKEERDGGRTLQQLP
jgi:hypothetical protein